MALIYSCVANKEVVLAEYSGKTGNFGKVVRKILEQIPTQQDGRMSYVYERHYFHYQVSGGIIFLCMAEESFGRRIPFLFLDDIRTRFTTTYGAGAKTTVPSLMQTDFSRVLQKQMDYFSNDANADKIASVKKGLDEVKGVMVSNIEKVLERGERIELLVDKTENLSQSSLAFKKKSTELKNVMWWKNIKLYLMIGAALLVLVYIIVAIACKGIIFQGCWPTPGEPEPPQPPAPVPSPQPAPLPPALPSPSHSLTPLAVVSPVTSDT